MSKTTPKLLMIDDDRALTELLSSYVATHGLEMVSAQDPRDALDKIKKENPDLLILDVMMPQKDGFAVLKDLRTSSSIPIIMLTARGESVDRILGLELGADDYISKPFEPRELVARIRAILKRTSRAPEDLIKSGDFVINPATRSVRIKDHEVDFTTMEYDLLHLLVSNPGRKFSRDQLLSTLHETETESYGRAIDNLVNRVRKKIETVSDSSCIKTVWGTGYMYTEIRRGDSD